MKGLISICLIVALLAGCTAVRVSELAKRHNIQHVCIEENKKVKVRDFLPVLEEGFNKHLITTEVYSGKKPDHCLYKVTYTALRSWDMVTYLSHAEVRIYKRDSKVAEAEYHLRGKGGFALTKFAGVRRKMMPVMDKLLSEYP